MTKSTKLKHFHSLLKDQAKLIKSRLSITNHTTSAIQIAVLRATTRSARSPPHDHLISALVSFSHTARHSAFACISTIIHRLHHHHQPNAYVALKSLITLHHIITNRPFTIDDRQMLSQVLSQNARFGFLNLSRFVDNTDTLSRDCSLWVQWYACVLEHNVSTSTTLGFPLSKIEQNKENLEKLKFTLYMDLFNEIETLVSTIEAISIAPKSLHCKKNDIIHEVIRLVGEDYRKVQYHTMTRLTELSERIHKLSSNELDELTRCLERLERCKERLTELFVNRRRNESFWDMETELMRRLVSRKSERLKVIRYESESTRLSRQLVVASRPL